MIKTFKGQSASDSIVRIRLSTNKGLKGYKIKKFQLISPSPGTNTCELVAKAYSIEPPLDADGTPTNPGIINFNDPTLMGVSYFAIAATSFESTTEVVFDNTTINQDMFITCFDNSGNTIALNYYVELEQVTLDVNEATVATLKDMRGRE